MKHTFESYLSADKRIYCMFYRHWKVERGHKQLVNVRVLKWPSSIDLWLDVRKMQRVRVCDVSSHIFQRDMSVSLYKGEM